MKCNMKYCIHCSGPRSAPKAQAIVPRRHLVMFTMDDGHKALEKVGSRVEFGGTTLVWGSALERSCHLAVGKSNSNFLAKPARCRRGTVNRGSFD